MNSNIGSLIFDNLEYIVITSSPLVVYGIYKLKKFKPAKNDLTPYIIKLGKQKESLNKRNKSTMFS